MSQLTSIMNCDETRTRLQTFLDGELPAEETESVLAHLAGCAPCAAAQSSLCALRDYVQRHGTTAAPDRLTARIQAIAAEMPRDTADSSSASIGPVKWLLPRLAAAGLGALLVGGAWVVDGQGQAPAAQEGDSKEGSPPGISIGNSIAHHLAYHIPNSLSDPGSAASRATSALPALQALQRSRESQILRWALSTPPTQRPPALSPTAEGKKK